MNILVTYNGSPNSSNAELFGELHTFLKDKHSCRLISTPHSIKKNLSTLTKRYRSFFWSDAIFLHSSAAFSADLILLGKIFGKKTIGYIWDEYPVSLSHKKVHRPLKIKLLDAVEKQIQKLLSVRIVPSKDFKIHKHENTFIFPLWPTHAQLTKNNHTSKPCSQKPVKIAFAGAVNETRGLSLCIKHLDKISQDSLELHIFSRINDELTKLKSTEKITIVQRGFLDKTQLDKALNQMHFGLISLHPNFESAAFPSKTFEYTSSNIPLLYYGPDLKHYISLIENAGVGQNITAEKAIDFEQTYNNLSRAQKPFNLDFSEETCLKWSYFEKVL